MSLQVQVAEVLVSQVDFFFLKKCKVATVAMVTRRLKTQNYILQINRRFYSLPSRREDKLAGSSSWAAQW